MIVITPSDIKFGIVLLTFTIVVSMIAAWIDLNYGYGSRQ